MARGARTDDLRDMEADTVQKLRDFLLIAEDLGHRRRALKIAADRLEDVVRDLRREAATPSAGAKKPPGGGEGGEGREKVS